MSKTAILAMAIAILALGAFVPGCSSTWDGFICAANTENQEFCVPSAQGPAAAWDKAAGQGTGPIEIWAERPQNMTVDALVESEDNLKAWFADIDKCFSYARDTKKRLFRVSCGSDKWGMAS